MLNLKKKKYKAFKKQTHSSNYYLDKKLNSLSVLSVPLKVTTSTTPNTLVYLVLPIFELPKKKKMDSKSPNSCCVYLFFSSTIARLVHAVC